MRRTILQVLLLLCAVVGVVPAAHAEPPKDLRAAAITALRSALADPDRGVRYAAVQALGKAGEAPTVFAGPLRDPEWCVRQEAAWWCRKAGAAAAPVLGEVIEKGTLEQKVSATWALSGLGAAAVPLLRQALGAEETEVRTEAIAAAQRLGLPAAEPLAGLLLPSLKASAADERLEAALALVTLRPDDAAAAVPALTEGFAGRDRWEACVDALLRAGAAGEEAVRQLVLDKRQKAHVEGMRTLLSEELARARTAESLPSPAPITPSEPAPPLPPPSRPPAPPPFDATALRSASVFDRIDAALEVGRRGGDAALLAPLVRDPERDVRVAAAMGLGHATGDADAPLLEAARDPRWQVQLAAVRSLGQRRAHPEIVAPFLRESVVALADAAHVALARSGAAAALPTAQQVATTHYGVLHHAPGIFEALGTDGAAAVPVLAGLLAHDDVNVRETAARCLRPIGLAARDAIPALVRALGDDRLCVINHVALALGRTGLSEPMLAALVDPRARVRAYATFALGWALGEARNLDQVPFEMRLPVLDVGDAGPFPTAAELDAALAPPAETDEDAPLPPRAPVAALLRRAIRSKDPALAVRAAGALDQNDVDVRDAERVMELLLPTGLRPGWPGSFERLRWIIGSAELPACLMYLLRARVTEPDVGHVCGAFHRISRADTIPALLWFERVEESDALRETGELSMPFSRTAAYLRERAITWLHRDPGGAPGAAARAYLEDCVKTPDVPWGQPIGWALRDLDPTPADVPLLLHAARVAESQHDGYAKRSALDAVLWVLARCSDPATEALLREIAADEPDPGASIARAALARRGDPEAIAELLGRIPEGEGWPIPLLAASAPGPAARALAAGLPDPAAARALLAAFEGWLADVGELGAHPLEEAFLGLEAAVAAAPPERGLGPVLRGRIAMWVPGCATRRIAEQVLAGFERGDADPVLDGEEPSDLDLHPDVGRRLVAFLRTADATRTDRIVRRWAASPQPALRAFACGLLLTLGDRESAALLVAQQRTAERGTLDVAGLARVGGPEALAFLREIANDEERAYSGDQGTALEALAHAAGWPANAPLDLEAFPEASRDAVRDALTRGDLAFVRSLYPDPAVLSGGFPTAMPVWERLATQGVRGDAHARADFWSALRTGRYGWLFEFDPVLHTLGRDPGTLPHWLSDLDSNCCRVSDGLDGDVFEEPYAMYGLYGTEDDGVAMPLSERARLWFRWSGGRFAWSPLGGERAGSGGFVPQAE